jgi:hypothetical protein
MTPDGDCLSPLVFSSGISAQAAIRRNALSLVFCGDSPYRGQAQGVVRAQAHRSDHFAANPTRFRTQTLNMN